MSTRTYLLAVESLEPIRNSVGSGDRHILDGLVANIDKRYPELVGYAETMIMGPERVREPGCWSYLIQPLANYLKLQNRLLPLSDWKHYHVWKEYNAATYAHVTSEVRSLLRWLEEGRAFRGSAVTHDGCMFAWLSHSEVALLQSELEVLDINQPDDLETFHAELVQSLSSVMANQMELFLASH